MRTTTTRLILILVVLAVAWPAAAQTWTTPRTWTLGELVSPPIMNTHIRDNLIVLRAGGIALPGQAEGDVLCASSATQFGRVAAQAAGRFLASGGATACPIYSADFTTTTVARLNTVQIWSATQDMELVRPTVDGGSNLGQPARRWGTVFANTFDGSGASLTSLNASNLSAGTVPDGRFPATLPAASGTNLTNLNASALTSGTVPSARVSGGYAGITGTGALNAGSITSAFGDIDIGGSSISSGPVNTGHIQNPLSISLNVDGLSRVFVSSTGMQVNVPTLPFTVTGSGTPLVQNGSGNPILRQTSSARYKTATVAAELDLATFLRLEPQRFQYLNGGLFQMGRPTTELGLIAEDAHELGLSEVVNYDGEGRPESFNQQALIAYLLAVVREQQRRIEALEAAR